VKIYKQIYMYMYCSYEIQGNATPLSYEIQGNATPLIHTFSK